MAPRTGPRGVTIEDVARRAYGDAAVPNVDTGALISYLTGGQAPGYGRQYGGFPTASYGQAAVQGQAYAIADLARQAAQLAYEREAQLVGQAQADVARNALGQAYKYRYQYQPSQGMRQAGQAVSEAEPGFQQMLARARLAAETGRQSQARQQELEDVQTATYERLGSDLASQVAPAQTIVETLGAVTPSQLAQQIAVSRYGYDPMLASGLFGAQTDLKYDLQNRQRDEIEMRRRGYDTSLNNDEILARTLTPQEFEAYQTQKAMRAYTNAFEPDYADVDTELFSAYGVVPANNMEREIMQDAGFADLVTRSKQVMQQSSSVSPTAVASQIARDFLVGHPDSAAQAILLENILRDFAFLVEDPVTAATTTVVL